jgi:hypothetical protein
MSSPSSPASGRRGRRTPIAATDARLLSNRLDRPVARDEVDSVRELIRTSLADGELDAAYDGFAEWLKREARYATVGRTTNLAEILEESFHLITWMYERVPRELARTAAQAA